MSFWDHFSPPQGKTFLIHFLWDCPGENTCIQIYLCRRERFRRKLENWCFWTAVLEKTLESPLDCKEIQPVHPKGDQSWVFFGRSDAKAETPILWPPDAKSWLIWKDPDAGKDWGQEEKGMTEGEMVEWHHRLNRHEFGYTSGVGDGQGGLACCSSWSSKESDTTERLNWTKRIRESSKKHYVGRQKVEIGTHMEQGRSKEFISQNNVRTNRRTQLKML